MAQGKIKDPAVGAMLRDLRKAKGAKSPQLFAQMMNSKYSVAGILRRESGAIALDFEYLEDFCTSLKLTEDETMSVWAAARVSQLKVRGAEEKIGEVYVELFKNCDKQSFFSGTYFPDFLQTVDYAAAVLSYFSSVKDPHSVAEVRFNQGLEMRKDTSKLVRGVCPEMALYMPHGSPSVMVEQLDYLLSFEDAPHFEFRILPTDVFLSIPTGEVFITLDERYCFAGSRLGMTTSEEPLVVKMFNDNFEKIWANSVIGIKRNKLVQKAIDHFKAML